MNRVNNIFTVARLSRGDTHKEAGFGVGSLLGGLAIVLLLYQGFEPMLARHRATPTVNEAAAHMDKVSLAAAQYVKDHYSDLTSSLALNGGARTITLATLKDSGYLSPTLADRNPYGQAYTLRVRYATQGSGSNTRNVLEPLVVTEGGRPIADNELLRIAGKLNAGGTIRSNSPNIAIGNSGGWEAALANYGGSPGAGHLAVGMFFSDAGMIADYLYRKQVPGRPEVNQMNTAIDMEQNAITDVSSIQTGEAHLTRIVTEASVCAPAGAIARNSVGNPMVCQGGQWTQTATLNWLPNQGQRMQITAANGQSMWLQNLNGKFRWVDSNWTKELASVDQAGNLRAAGRVSVGEYLHIEGRATENAACPVNGLIGVTTVGVILSCQSRVWKSSTPNNVGKWSNVTGSRSASTAYRNGSRLLAVMATVRPGERSTGTYCVDANCVQVGDGDWHNRWPLFFIVPPNSTYSINAGVLVWHELYLS